VGRNYSTAQLAAIPAAVDVRAALKLILGSSGFSQSPMLSTFLTFVVEATLGGRGDYIKAYTIAVDGLGRRNNFNPEADAIVRVHAIRVRRALKSYYDAMGAGSAIIIDLPLRRYVPTFSYRIGPEVRPAMLPAVRPLLVTADTSVTSSRPPNAFGKWIRNILGRSPEQVDC
jgi:hypothetical protein